MTDWPALILQIEPCSDSLRQKIESEVEAQYYNSTTGTYGPLTDIPCAPIGQ